MHPRCTDPGRCPDRFYTELEDIRPLHSPRQTILCGAYGIGNEHDRTPPVSPNVKRNTHATAAPRILLGLQRLSYFAGTGALDATRGVSDRCTPPGCLRVMSAVQAAAKSSTVL